MGSEEPRPTSDLDESLHKIASQASTLQRAAFIALCVIVGILILGVLVLIFRTRADEQRIESSCSFWREVVSLPVVAKASRGSPQTSKLGVTLILGARNSFIGQDCPGNIPKPSPGLQYLDRLYHV
jgi:hypothetical protein